DGVGDACDPRIVDGGDFIAFFDGFDGAALRPEWVVVAGEAAWSVSADQLHFPNITNANLLGISTALPPNVTVVTRVTFQNHSDLGQPPGTANAGVVLRSNSDNGML